MRFKLPYLLRWTVAAAASICAGDGFAAPIMLGELTPIFQGVDIQSANVGESRALSVRVDLDAPGIAFTTTPRGGPLETVAQTTSQFLESSGTQVAINAGFFAPCCERANEPKDVIGLAISDGTLVSPFAADRPASLLLTADNEVTIANLTGAPDGIDDAVTGSNILVDDGLSVAPPTVDGFTGPNPRTAAGVSADGRFLFLVTIDGRQPGFSIGATLVETADLLLALGAFDAVNLDGGGSTTLVRAGKMGEPIVLNRPSGIIGGVNVERFNGNNFGVFALPLQVGAPGSLALMLVGAFGLIIVSRGQLASAR